MITIIVRHVKYYKGDIQETVVQNITIDPSVDYAYFRALFIVLIESQDDFDITVTKEAEKGDG